MPTFCKEDRLCNRNYIFSLQKEGRVIYSYPITAKWMEIPDNRRFCVQFLPAVSKRNFKKAVERNKIKRFLREALRLNKEKITDIAQKKSKKVVIMLLYSGKNILTYKELETKIVIILQQIAFSL
jgi:ribonuclease P protein component